VSYAEGKLGEALTHWQRALELDGSLETELGPVVRDLDSYLKKYPQ
jgi:hypothetical protein